MSTIRKKARRCLTDSEIFKTAVFSSRDLCGHGTKVHRLLDDIAVSGDKLWIDWFEEESVIILSEGESAMCFRVGRGD